MTGSAEQESGYCKETTEDGLICAQEAGHDGPHGSLEDGEIVWWPQ